MPPMTEAAPKKTPGVRGRALKLFGLMLLVLLVPLAMDQLDVDREQLKVVGRVAAGLAALMFVYGLFAKLMKLLGFVVMLLLIGVVVLVSEQQIEMPRVKALFDARAERGK
jgi:hypothetical protein